LKRRKTFNVEKHKKTSSTGIKSAKKNQKSTFNKVIENIKKFSKRKIIPQSFLVEKEIEAIDSE
jgi:hypothetical protein